MVTTGIHRKKGKKQDFDLKIPAIILALCNCIRYVLSENEKNFVDFEANGRVLDRYPI